MVSSINILINLCFSISKNVVTVQDILEIYNVDRTLTRSARYNARIWFHYIAWALKISLDDLNEVNNCFTWMKCFTRLCHKMDKAGILK